MVNIKRMISIIEIEINILIKDLSGKNGIDGQFIRIAIKTPEENQKLIKALISVFKC
jgi:histidinol-phosphate/aromatic aminotransferase/cobyric acid decarboxylase-like protein